MFRNLPGSGGFEAGPALTLTRVCGSAFGRPKSDTPDFTTSPLSLDSFCALYYFDHVVKQDRAAMIASQSASLWSPALITCWSCLARKQPKSEHRAYPRPWSWHPQTCVCLRVHLGEMPFELHCLHLATPISHGSSCMRFTVSVIVVCRIVSHQIFQVCRQYETSKSQTNAICMPGPIETQIPTKVQKP